MSNFLPDRSLVFQPRTLTSRSHGWSGRQAVVERQDGDGAADDRPGGRDADTRRAALRVVAALAGDEADRRSRRSPP